jgi:hypothetical protein
METLPQIASFVANCHETLRARRAPGRAGFLRQRGRKLTDLDASAATLFVPGRLDLDPQDSVLERGRRGAWLRASGKGTVRQKLSYVRSLRA